MPSNRVRGVPPKAAPAGTPQAKIWETLEARLDKQSEEIEECMQALGLKRVSVKEEATEREKMIKHFEATKGECERVLAMMNGVLKQNGKMLKERIERIDAMLDKVRERSEEAFQEARAVKASLKKDNADIQKALMDLKGLDAKLTECFKNSMGRVDALKAELEDTATKDALITTDLCNLTGRVKVLEARYHGRNLLSRQNMNKRLEELGGQVHLLARNVVASQDVAEQADGGDQSSGLYQEVDVCQKTAAMM